MTKKKRSGQCVYDVENNFEDILGMDEGKGGYEVDNIHTLRIPQISNPSRLFGENFEKWDFTEPWQPSLLSSHISL